MARRLVFSYLAFSTPQQSDGRSTDRQETSAETWAKAHGFVLAPGRQYRDEGVSRFHGDARMKGALSRFLALCGTDAVPVGSILIVEDFDRLSRECPDDAWELFRQILLAGVEIVILSLDRWFKPESLNRFEDRLLIQACQHRAHQESAMKAKRISDIWADRRRRAAAGNGVRVNPPSWMQRNGSGALELVAERAETIRLMVSLIRGGLGTHRTAGELTTGPNARPCWLRGGAWNSEGIQQILLKPAIWGGYQPHRRTANGARVPTGELVEGFYPAVLTREEADALRRLISSRRNHRGRPATQSPSMLTGLVRDAETGGTLFRSASGVGGQWRTLSRRWQGKVQTVVPYGVVESLVLRAVQDWSPDALTPTRPDGDQARAAELRSELSKVAADRAAISAELGKPGRAKSTAAIFADQLDQLDAREAELKEALADLDSAVAGIDAVRLSETQSLAVRYAGLPEAEKSAAAAALNGRLREILDGVWIYRRTLTPRTAELVVQIWPRAGAMKERRVFVGKPPAGYVPLDVGAADFRGGFPSSLPSGKSPKKAAV